VLGIAYHHAGLSLDERRLVEELFRQDYIQVLCSTSTLYVFLTMSALVSLSPRFPNFNGRSAQGVNLPAHLVVIKSTSFWAKDGFKQYDVSSLHQMIGRAGRPQYDDSAVAGS
jgi:ATP-dependent DNA helicase HFM1/MER3